ncbi:MAG: hypothetical protein L0Y74_03830 [candidate division Zixibacteria bacterium]|nr:hypothetical protein [candidate division Zixibacteria bacterium]
MSYKFSDCICLQTPDIESAKEFYSRVMGLEIVKHDEKVLELKAGQNRLFLDKGPHLGPITEFLVPDLERAKTDLLKHGCEVVRWDGRGGCCYLQDPFGLIFNLFQESDYTKT